MNEIDKTQSPSTPSVDISQRPPADGVTAPGAPLPYDTVGAPSPKVEKDDAPPLDHEPKTSYKPAAASEFTYQIIGTVAADVFAIMDVMEKAMDENAKVAEDEAIESALQVAAKLREVAGALRKAAKFALAAGIAMGVMQIFAGMIALGGAMKSSSTLSATGTEPEVSEPTEEPESTKSEDEEEAETTKQLKETSDTSESTEAKQSAEEEDTEDEIAAQKKKLQQTVQKAEDENFPTADADEEVSDTDKADTEDEQTKAKEKKKLRAKNKDGGNLVTYQKAQNITTFSQGLSQIVQGTGQIISTILKYCSDQKQADSKEIEADAAQQKSLAEQKKSYSESVQRDADKIYEQMQQLQQSEYETTGAITTRV